MCRDVLQRSVVHEQHYANSIADIEWQDAHLPCAHFD